jgi:hypothetical protein
VVISDLNIRETDELTELRRRVDDVLQTDNRGLGKLNAACVFQAPLDKSIEELDAAYQQLLRQLNAKYHLNLASDSFNLSQDALHSDGKLACLTSEQVIVRITRIQAQLSNTKNTPPLPPKRRHSTDKSAG